jgi:hypothetical protein
MIRLRRQAGRAVFVATDSDCVAQRLRPSGLRTVPPSRHHLRRGAVAHAVGFRFQGVVLDDGKAGAERVAHPAGALLQDVRQFVAEELLAGGGVRLEAAGGEVDVRADGEGNRADALGLRALVHAHGGEVGVEGLLHLALHRIGKGLAGPAGGAQQGGIDGDSSARGLRLGGTRLHLWGARLGDMRRRRRARHRRRLGYRHRQLRPAAEKGSLDHATGHRAPPCWRIIRRVTLRFRPAVRGVRLAAGDGAGIEDQPEIMIEADEDAEILLFDLG